MNRQLPDPATLDWGSMSKAEFKRRELEYELAHEDNAIILRGTNRMQQQDKFNTDEVLALAVAVDREQGFIRSGYGFTDENGKTVKDNKTAIMMNLLDRVEEKIVITDEDRKTAESMKEHFSGSLTFKKLGATLNDFEQAVLNLVNTDEVGVYEVSVAASLPNSMRHSVKRDAVKERLDALIARSLPVGSLNQRGRFVLDVVDVTFIKKMGVHMVTCIESDNNVVKFWFSKDPDVTGVLQGNTITVTGFVKTQGKSKYSNCMETMINRVKVEKIG